VAIAFDDGLDAKESCFFLPLPALPSVAEAPPRRGGVSRTGGKRSLCLSLDFSCGAKSKSSAQSSRSTALDLTPRSCIDSKEKRNKKKEITKKKSTSQFDICVCDCFCTQNAPQVLAHLFAALQTTPPSLRRGRCPTVQAAVATRP
jgi:hypothetical protein